MPYCKSCGAYIPDGLTACLACGYDDTVVQAGAASQKQAAPKPERNDDVREVMERHRRLQQEKNKQWAEKEKERREQQRENRRWAQEEYAVCCHSRPYRTTPRWHAPSASDIAIVLVR